MPTPYGTRGGMAFGAEELCVLRRALALALRPRPVRAEDLQDCLRLAESLDEAMREGTRLRAFLLADLARYRDALPGTAIGYLTALSEAVTAGHRPTPADLSALRTLRAHPAAAALLDRYEPAAPAAPTVPASRSPLRGLQALPGGLPGARSGEGGDPGQKPAKRPAPKPGERPAPAQPGRGPAPEAPRPARRPIPTPGEVFPRRKPSPPSGDARERLAVV
ncbi:hypothetical protein [Streptomyces anandii]|uniref:hypothetical protein n=1 Tax=Streptomyces anandii TaxID=285454 RepID=UPI001677F20C|nr:hypothetical protein [Streptomyces anandii]